MRRMTREQMADEGRRLAQVMFSEAVGMPIPNATAPGWYYTMMVYQSNGVEIPGRQQFPYLWKQRMGLVRNIQHNVQQTLLREQQKQREEGQTHKKSLLYAPASAFPKGG